MKNTKCAANNGNSCCRFFKEGKGLENQFSENCKVVSNLRNKAVNEPHFCLQGYTTLLASQNNLVEETVAIKRGEETSDKLGRKNSF